MWSNLLQFRWLLLLGAVEGGATNRCEPRAREDREAACTHDQRGGQQGTHGRHSSARVDATAALRIRG